MNDITQKIDITVEGISNQNKSHAVHSGSRNSSIKGPRITKVEIKNFKKIKETSIDLGPITYLVGGNNSGKSSVLQAIHTAVSCAQSSVETGQKVIAEARLRYSPVADFSLLGHKSPYTNRSKGQKGTVKFYGDSTDGTQGVDYSIEMYKARNHNNVGVNRDGYTTGFGNIISDSEKLFSVYVPGLAGVSHREEMSGYAAVFRKAASGDANLVFRNIIRLLNNKGLLCQLEELIQSILQIPVKFKVKFEEESDIYVNVLLTSGSDENNELPVELWGTGLLQITQIFAYVLLFKPAILLVDEPDSHLHPSRQKSLGRALEKVSSEFNCNVIISTHSRHLLTGASSNVKIVWMQDGDVESSDQPELTALLLDLGALDQLDNETRTVLWTEDENPKILQKVIEGICVDGYQVELASYNGVNNSLTTKIFSKIADLLQSSPRALLHRDRDFLTESELEEWSHPYIEQKIEIFCPELCDTESYLVTASHISRVTGLDLKEAEDLRLKVIKENIEELRDKYRNKRRAAIRKYYPDGGGPATSELWPDDEDPTEEKIYGKLLLQKIDKELRKMGKLKKAESLSDHPNSDLRKKLIKTLKEGGHNVGDCP